MTPSSAYVELIRHLVAALNSRRIYPPHHPALDRALDRVEQALHGLMVSRDQVHLGVLGERLLGDGLPWEDQAESHTTLSRELKTRGIDKLTFQRGFTRADLESLLEVLSGDQANPDFGLPASVSVSDLLAGRGVSRIRVAHLDLVKKEAAPGIVEKYRGAYQEAVEGVEEAMEAARAGRLIRIHQVQRLVQSLLEHLTEDPGPLLMLTALKSHSDYVFTHLINVAILVMAQIQSFTSDPEVIREYGIAALLHDAGKARVPSEILDRRGKLSDAEFEVIRRHPLDTLRILRETPGTSDLCLIVGFEHHRRFDKTGYPFLRRPLPQHFASRVIAVADAYDAMRSNRCYQQEMPPERVLEILRRESGKMFDPLIVRAFVRITGAYPPGTRVRLDGGEEAIVLKANPDDPLRPIVRLVTGPDPEDDLLRLVSLTDRDPKSGAYLRSVVRSLSDSHSTVPESQKTKS